MRYSEKCEKKNMIRKTWLPRPRHGYEYIKYKICPSMIIVMCNKQH